MPKTNPQSSSCPGTKRRSASGSKHEHGVEIADRLAKEDLVEDVDLERLSKPSPSELVTVVSFNAKQARALHAALKELF